MIQGIFMATPINQIQGASHISPLLGQTVTTTGVVTAVIPSGSGRGFYLQNPIADNDPATSEGIFVFLGSASLVNPIPGQAIAVTGRVEEFRPGNNPNNLTITQINANVPGSSLTIVPALGPVPVTILGQGGRIPPDRTIKTTPITQNLPVVGRAALEEIQQTAVVPNTPSTGSFTYQLSGNQLVISGSYSSLTSPLVSGNPIRLQVAPAGSNGPVIRDLSVTTTSTTAGNFSGNLSLTPGELADFQAGRLYVNLATSTNPNGELRGQLGPSVELSSFNANTDGIDFYESVEGMLVQVNNAVAVSPTNVFSAGTSGEARELWVLADGGSGASGRSPRGGINISPTDFNPERIQIDDTLIRPSSRLPLVDVGAKLDTISGVVSYNFSNYEIQILAPVSVSTPSSLTRETTNLKPDPRFLRIADFNVENLSPGAVNDREFGGNRMAAVANIITRNLLAPDILSLSEIQDNNGSTDDGTVSATATLSALIEAIRAAGGPTYEFRQIDPVNNQDGGQPGGNIRVVFLFNPARVQFVDRPGGGPNINTGVVNVGGQPQFSISPGRIIDTNLADGDAFSASRKPLVGEFVFNGEKFFVIGNHFNSKGGDQPLFGPTQPPILSSESQRQQQAAIVAGYVTEILKIDPNAKVAVLGDLNDFQFSRPVNTLKAAGLISLTETLAAGDRYTFNFQGNSQVLDHILVSRALSSSTYDIIHINSEFSNSASDHDPTMLKVNTLTSTTSQFLAKPNPSNGNIRVGTSGNDVLYGSTLPGPVDTALINDDIFGEAGNDLLSGLTGNDNLFGGLGDDLIYGDSGNDWLAGEGGDDQLFGGGGNDLLEGGAGNDLLLGGAGNDTLVGGSGSDRFRLINAPGPDIITDFTPGTDLIELSRGLEFASLRVSAIAPNITAIGTATNPNIALLFGVNPAALTASSFVTI